ncbi:hypothetical protein JOM56_002414 [Amanita muscaria]
MSSDQESSTAGSSVVPNDSNDTTNTHSVDELSKSLPEHASTFGEISVATSDAKFKEELTAIESWLKVLSRSERTASIYTLLQDTDKDQKRFFIATLQQTLKAEDDTKSEPKADDDTESKPKIDDDTGSKPKAEDTKLKAKPFVRGLRPPSLNLPEPESPTTPRCTPATSKGDSFAGGHDTNKAEQNSDGASAPAINIPGIGMVNPQLLNMAAASGLSTEAQMLAIQLVTSGLVQPPKEQGAQAPPKSSKKVNWRVPVPGSAKYPGSALRHLALRSAGLQSAGLKSAGLDSAMLDGGATPKEEDFDPEALKDIPGWLRGLRLHKYTQCFDGMTWQEMVELDDEALEKKGIVTLGARRRLVRTFEIVKKKMGMERPSSATPTEEGGKAAEDEEERGGGAERVPPHSAAAATTCMSRLSASSPVFVPQSALPRLGVSS